MCFCTLDYIFWFVHYSFQVVTIYLFIYFQAPLCFFHEVGIFGCVLSSHFYCVLTIYMLCFHCCWSYSS